MQNDLETRLTSLENQLKRQKITTLALCIGAIVAISATRVVSQNEARELTLRTLKIVGKDGKVRVLIAGDALSKDGGGLAVFDSAGKPRVGIMASPSGGQVSILGQESEPMAILGFDGQSGSLGLSTQGSKTAVNLAATKKVSGLVVSGADGKPQLVAGADKNGGVVQVYDGNGKLKKQWP